MLDFAKREEKISGGFNGMLYRAILASFEKNNADRAIPDSFIYQFKGLSKFKLMALYLIGKNSTLIRCAFLVAAMVCFYNGIR